MWDVGRFLSWDRPTRSIDPRPYAIMILYFSTGAHRERSRVPQRRTHVGPWMRLRGDGRRECFDQSEAECEVQARSVRSGQRDAKGRALQSPGEGDCERSWLRDDARTMYRGERRSRCNPGSVCVTEDTGGVRSRE